MMRAGRLRLENRAVVWVSSKVFFAEYKSDRRLQNRARIFSGLLE